MEYKDYPDNAKVWIYQSNKHLDNDEIAYLKVQIDDFITTWESHGQMLTATSEIFHNLFVVFFVDEQGDIMCGRAQDASVNLIKKLEGELEVTFLDRMVQSYKKGEKVEVVEMNDFSTLLADHLIDENTIVFNNMVTTKADFDSNWEISLKESWHKQFLVIS
ncbi:MAG: ABC transporter ATPase [Flavobacteriales bacterium]|nr:MAG: ABC transporter ATPase [Flavobacteriales bacterium]